MGDRDAVLAGRALGCFASSAVLDLAQLASHPP
jgi:hypothetical protein